MSKYQLICSCIQCHIQTTAQSLKSHSEKCAAVPKNQCGCCGQLTNNPHFCSRSCRATVTNKLRVKKPHIAKQSRFEVTLQRFQSGEIHDRPTIRKCLTYHSGYACNICGLSTWLDNPITLIVDHIDGHADNNMPVNLRLICPNCNSQTPTFGGRNKGNGRKARGLKLH